MGKTINMFDIYHVYSPKGYIWSYIKISKENGDTGKIIDINVKLDKLCDN